MKLNFVLNFKNHFGYGQLFSFCFISEEIMKQIISNNTQNSLK